MKKIILFLMALFTTVCYAQSDFEIAQSFMSKKGVKLVNNERSLTRGVDSPYSIYNGENNKGFAIVVNGEVVGYDINNTIDASNISCCLKAFLSEYSEMIPKGKTRGNDDPDWWTPRNVTPIEPLIKTHWSQSSPYNDLLEKKSGICVLVAWCQLIHYFRVPQTYKEKVVNDTLTLPITYFDHSKMLNSYNKNIEYNNGEKEEVAKLFSYYHYIDCYGFTEYLGMEMTYMITDYSDTVNYYKYYDELLESSIPYWTGGTYHNSGHAFLIDGRDSEGRYHINFGWGEGSSDGYYVLPNKNANKDKYDGNRTTLGYVSTCKGGYVIKPIYFEWSPTTSTNISITRTINTSNSSVYNLQGRKIGNSLEGLPKGIYIQNRKKYIIK